MQRTESRTYRAEVYLQKLTIATSRYDYLELNKAHTHTNHTHAHTISTILCLSLTRTRTRHRTLSLGNGQWQSSLERWIKLHASLIRSNRAALPLVPHPLPHPLPPQPAPNDRARHSLWKLSQQMTCRISQHTHLPALSVCVYLHLQFVSMYL